ncbi:MAG TPA: UDP-N-acetylmuramoyl-tripeptide--D-alanyl-D-alanine ligase, partial [Bacillota bacterium]|nr:UDP-N-acetylmuramoyl-tripeptide--D-alanyl-D-alanine ligase [Bacillota bacterium]
MVEFTIQEIVNAVGGKLIQGNSDLRVRGVSTDSRRIQPEELFIALKGERFDGHRFIEAVAQLGAAAVVVMEPVAAPAGVAVIQVTDTLVALGAIARAHRRRFNIPTIGITGSNGKTTTKDLIAAVLEQACRVIKTEQNFNNEIGLPLTLFKITETTEATVVEMGMRGLGQIRQLAEIAEPTIGVVTNVGLTHLELLKSQENIAKAKAELVEALDQNGVAILNGDDPYVRAMQSLNRGKTVLYGIDTDGLDYRATGINSTVSGTEFNVETPDGTLAIKLPLPGRHNILNALAAVAVGKTIGLSDTVIQAGLMAPEMTGKRLHILEHDGYRVIDDTYNASPTSVRAALDVLAGLQSVKRSIAVLADMLELGPDAARLHRDLG